MMADPGNGRAGGHGGDKRGRRLKMAYDYGPLAVFFVTYSFWGIYAATAALMATTIVAVALGLVIERKLPMLPLFTALLVAFFGGLTLIFQDETFIKMKPTVIQLVFAALLLGGRLLNLRMLSRLFGSAMQLSRRGWQILEIRLALFFVAMAGLNEVVWRTQSTDFWVNFKVFGLTALTLAFFAAQYRLFRRHLVLEDGEEAERPGGTSTSGTR